MCAGSDNQGNIVQYTFGTLVDGTIDEVEERVVSALADEGFGILTRIDLAATLKAKLDIDRSPYVILGACNPQLAHSMVEVDEEIGALLPCNVVLRQEGTAWLCGFSIRAEWFQWLTTRPRYRLQRRQRLGFPEPVKLSVERHGSAGRSQRGCVSTSQGSGEGDRATPRLLQRLVLWC